MTNAQKKELLKDRLTSAAYARDREAVYFKNKDLRPKDSEGRKQTKQENQSNVRYWRNTINKEEGGGDLQIMLDKMNAKYEKYMGHDMFMDFIKKTRPEDFNRMFPESYDKSLDFYRTLP